MAGALHGRAPVVTQNSWVPTGNAAGTSRISRSTGDQWEAYDRLPEAVRQMLQDMNQNYCASRTAELLRPILLLVADQEAAVELFVAAQRDAEAGEILKFSTAYAQKYMIPYPHTAAGATTMRWAERVNRRNQKIKTTPSTTH